MLVKNLRNSFNPYPKNGLKNGLKIEKEQCKKELKTDFCIMPQSTKYSTKRTKNTTKGMRCILIEHIEIKA